MKENNWHTFEKEELLKQLKTSENGLTTKQANERKEKYGKNMLPKGKNLTILQVFLSQFINPIIFILAFAAVFSFLIGEYIDTIFIIVVVLLDAMLGTYQEWQAEKKAHSLQDMIKVKVKVLRNGKEMEMDSEDVTIGDVIYLESGNKIIADMRLISSYNLTVDESFLTGESFASNKTSISLPLKTALADRENMCYAGSKVMTGRAIGIVVNIGKETEIGKIAEKVSSSKEEKTPLGIRMEKFTKQLSLITAIIALLLILVLYYKGYAPKELFLAVIALSVSAIPEGLPVVLTVSLSIATSRMARKNVIVRKLNAVEGLGSCTVIASDKTGTLTLNEQTAKAILLADGSYYTVTGQGYNDEGKIVASQNGGYYKDSMEHLNQIIDLCSKNNEANLEKTKEGWIYYGDAIDVAFKALALKNNMPSMIEPIFHIPYESEKRYSALFYKQNDRHYTTIKGSLETVLKFCDKKLGEKGITKLKEEEIWQQNDTLSREGYRVIAVAAGENKEFVRKEYYEEADIPRLTFLGLVAFIDPIRKEAKSSIQKCLHAGIKVIMITGDYPLTATTIAKDLKLIQNEEEVCTGEELSRFLEQGPEVFDKFIANKKVFSRVDPIQKLEIVNSYKRQGEFIAVTGDGVNDAPALRGANVGIAMGSGTDVAKETGSMLITDDNFLSIVSGVEEGRYAYNNIRKVTYLLISCSVAEVLFFVLTILMDYPIPLLAIQLLWLNLFTEGLQDVALAFEEGEEGVMDEKPRRPEESLFDKDLIIETLLSGIVMCAILFGTWVYLIEVLKYDIVVVRSYIIFLMVFLQNMHVFNCRSEKKSVFKIPFKNNWFIVLGVLFTVLLQFFVSETTFLDPILQTQAIPVRHLFYLVLISLPQLGVMELYKYWKSKKR